jgi:hypothetical protein
MKYERHKSCKSHCCNNAKHGFCKYGMPDCPVYLGDIRQDYPCEMCSKNRPKVVRRSTKDAIDQFMNDIHWHNSRIRDAYLIIDDTCEKIDEVNQLINNLKIRRAKCSNEAN